MIVSAQTGNSVGAGRHRAGEQRGADRRYRDMVAVSKHVALLSGLIERSRPAARYQRRDFAKT
jgi:hypothetical protein